MTLDALQRSWDVVVIGAGVAGAASAHRLARRGLQVLLVDKAHWPREKVCGGCVNAAALRALKRLGAVDLHAAGPTYSRMRIACGGRQAEFPLPTGRAVSRARLDALLTDAACAAGACFLPATHAAAGSAGTNSRTVSLRQGNRQVQVSARLVLGCDGLGGQGSHNRQLQAGAAAPEPQVDPGAPMGLGAMVSDDSAFYAPGTIHMACGPHGYVGLVRVAQQQLMLAAALDPAWVKACGGPARAVARTLESASLAVPETLLHARWRGTPRLTRRRARLGGRRLLVLGDAAGYVEPFTGEGIAWALAGAAAVEPLALTAMDGWYDELVDQWTARHAAVIGPRQRGCRLLAPVLRRPRLVRALLPLIGAAPRVLAPLTAWVNRDYRSDFTSNAETDE